MNTRLFLARHRPLHDELIPDLVQGLTESRFRSRSHPDLPPIAWLLWHMARCEDVGANRMATDGTQVLDSGFWSDRLGVVNRDYGTGMTAKQVDGLAAEVVLEELQLYRQTVADRTREIALRLSESELDTPLDRDYVRKVLFDEGVAGPGAEWVEPHFVGQTRGWCLMHFCMTHNFYHLGQAVMVKKLFG